MSDRAYAAIEHRGAISVTGEDTRDFLQGLISNDIRKVGPARAIYAALLTPQGKFLHDFFIAEADGALVFDCEAARIPDLFRRLTMYRLRAKVEFTDLRDGWAVYALFGEGAAAALGLGGDAGDAAPFAGGVVYVDPRLAELGARALLPRQDAEAALAAAGFAAASPEDYDRLRLAHGVPDGGRDIPVDKAFLLEGNFEELNGVDFAKGCYVGQELTARTKHRGVVRKRLYRVDVEGPLPAPGTAIMLGEREAGVMGSGRDGTGIALLRLEQVAKAAETGEALTAGEARLTPVKPDWAGF